MSRYLSSMLLSKLGTDTQNCLPKELAVKFPKSFLGNITIGPQRNLFWLNEKIHRSLLSYGYMMTSQQRPHGQTEVT